VIRVEKSGVKENPVNLDLALAFGPVYYFVINVALLTLSIA
jgi:hypothetical protein